MLNLQRWGEAPLSTPPRGRSGAHKQVSLCPAVSNVLLASPKQLSPSGSYGNGFNGNRHYLAIGEGVQGRVLALTLISHLFRGVLHNIDMVLNGSVVGLRLGICNVGISVHLRLHLSFYPTIHLSFMGQFPSLLGNLLQLSGTIYRK